MAADPFITTPPSAENKKRMLFVMDVSGSMYYFNGFDHRLDRLLEASTLIMEVIRIIYFYISFLSPPLFSLLLSPHLTHLIPSFSLSLSLSLPQSFSGFSDKIDYAFVGHSGDAPEIPLINFGAPPKSRAERFKILRGMHAHTQYCYRGDHTLEVFYLFISFCFVSLCFALLCFALFCFIHPFILNQSSKIYPPLPFSLSLPPPGRPSSYQKNHSRRSRRLSCCHSF